MIHLSYLKRGSNKDQRFFALYCKKILNSLTEVWACLIKTLCQNFYANSSLTFGASGFHQYRHLKHYILKVWDRFWASQCASFWLYFCYFAAKSYQNDAFWAKSHQNLTLQFHKKSKIFLRRHFLTLIFSQTSCPDISASFKPCCL